MHCIGIHFNVSSFSDSFIEISKFYQGYIDNEWHLNPEGKCDATCEEYVETRHYHCTDCLPRTVQESQLICNGTVLNCQYFDGSISICPSVSNFFNGNIQSLELKLSLCMKCRNLGRVADINSWNTMTVA